MADEQPKQNNKRRKLNKETYDAAAEAMMKALTLDRHAEFSQVVEIVETVLASDDLRHLLPVLICYLRNHDKSSAPGTGSGERTLAERLVVALYKADPPSGVVLLRFLVMYGSWKSLLNILVFCDRLANPEIKNVEDEAEKTKIISGGRGCRAGGRGRGAGGRGRGRGARPIRAKQQLPKLEHSAANEGPYKDLCNEIHKLFAKQLKADHEEVKESANDPDKKPHVSNASKYSPHEKRGHQLTAAHADAVAKYIFHDNNKNGEPTAGLTDAEKYKLRRQYRHIRAALNEANRHLPDRYLSLHRADELDVGQITAGYMAKNRKALLNLDNKSPKKVRFPDDDKRMALRRKVIEASNRPNRVPPPSDIQKLADSLLEIGDPEKTELDDGEVALLGATFGRAVLELTKKVKEKEKEAKGVFKAMGDDEAAAKAQAPNNVLVAIDVSSSQAHALHVKAILCLLFCDTLEATGPAETPSERDDGDEKPAARECIVFDQQAHTVTIPSRCSPDGTERKPSERLWQLTKLLRSASAHVASQELSEDRSEGYRSLVSLLNDKATENSVAVVCSDFAGTDDFVASTKNYVGGSICCWKMSAPTRKRARKICWDPNNPQIDLCFVMDTTGSMGGHIENCKQEIARLLDSLASESGMPVACSFVSYKDFGNPGHLETHNWVEASDPAQVRSLREFITRLNASGGDDCEEDVAGGLEKAAELFQQRNAVPAIKLVLLVADFGAHGYPRGRPKHDGVDQKKRLQTVVKGLASAQRFGAEILLTRITSNTDMMCEAMDSWLQEEKTFVEQFEVGHVASSVFRDKILSCLQGVVSHAVAPPTAEGLDVYGGTDFGVVGTLMISRMTNYIAELVGNEPEEESTGDEENGDGEESKVEKTGEVGPKVPAKTPSAFANLLGKLESEYYNMVREAVGALKEGAFADYAPPGQQELGTASVVALLQAGLTVDDLVEAGYPEYVVALFRETLREQLRQGAAKRED